MQQEKIELPKFTVPGQNNWMKWALVGVGGLVAVSFIAFGVALSRRTGTQAVVVTPVRADEAPAPAVAIPASQSQPKAALAAASAAPADSAPAIKEEAAAPVAAAKPKARRSSHHGHTRSLAKATSGSSKPSTGKPDALDDLLKRFK
jgi:hypothetical protein